MEKYDDYKDSGVKQIGQIPRKWEVKKLKYLTSINQDSLPEHTDRESDIYYVDIGSVTMEAGINEVEHFKFGKAPSRARRLAKKGDTIISTVRTYLKAIGYVGSEEKKYVYSTGFAVLQPSKKIVPEYLYSFVKSDLFTNQVDTFSIGISYPAINSSTLGELYVAVPPKDTQATIATYLDQKTAQIDTAIAQKEQLIELLQERKQIIIQRAVTRGLDETVKMKDSEVEWIGKVPGHWEVKKLKYVLVERKDRSETGEEPLFMVSQVHGLVVRSDYHAKAEVAASNVGNKLVDLNDLVFNKLKAHLGVFFKSTIESTGLVSPDYAVYQSLGLIEDMKYLEILFRDPGYIGQFIIRATGIVEGLIRLYTGDLFDIEIPVPPAEEQKDILNFTNNVTDKIGRAIHHQTQQIARLREYRTVLIDAAVTGKIKVG
jgi:type I restriction enzyme S subunit